MEKQPSRRLIPSGHPIPAIGWLIESEGPFPAMADLLSRHGYALTEVRTEHPCPCQLVIVDCGQVSLACAQHYLARHYHSESGQVIALYDVPARSGYEQLISWPMIKGIFPSECSHDHLLKGIALLLAGENWFPRRILDEWLERQRTTPLAPPALPAMIADLTDRERQILRHIDMAFTNAQIAVDLSISEHTVKTHIYNIFRKISVRNRTQASNWVKANLRELEA